jgi:hypothetical protein
MSFETVYSHEFDLMKLLFCLSRGDQGHNDQGGKEQTLTSQQEAGSGAFGLPPQL